MTLVQRFIQISDWPTSRKTALLSGITFLGSVVASFVAHFTWQPTGLLRMDLFDQLSIYFTLGLGMSLLLSLYPAWKGVSARWTGHLFCAVYTLGVVANIHMFGSSSTMFVAWYLMAVLMFILYFDTRLGTFGCLYGAAPLFVVLYLEGSGRLPYAPLLLERNIDAQQGIAWVSAHYFVTFQIFIVCFFLCLLGVSARRLQEAKLQTTQTLIRRYVPAQLAEQIISGRLQAGLKPERANLTIFFSDVEGFTNASDELDPEQLSEILNEYLSEMTEIAERHGATIDKFVGDGIMMFFGAPTVTNDKDHAQRAVQMSLEMQRRMTELQRAWFSRGFQRPFRIRIGINTGFASVGDFGSKGRVMYSAIGVQANLAARIQAQCDPGKVLISHSTWALVHDKIACTDKGELQLKGIHYPVKVYEIQ